MLLIGFAGIGFAAYRKVGQLAAGEELRPLFRPRISATTNQRTPPRRDRRQFSRRDWADLDQLIGKAYGLGRHCTVKIRHKLKAARRRLSHAS
jgi:hypothetical protein